MSGSALRTWHRISLALVVALALAACGGSATRSTEANGADKNLTSGGASATTAAAAETTITVAAATNASEAPADDASGGALLGSGGTTPVTINPADLGRDIIFTADIGVAVDDVAAAGRKATQVISGLGGFLFAQETSGGTTPHSILTFKVFPKDFQTALDRLGAIGEVRTQNVSADDVTERVVDLQSRITTAGVSVERLRGLLDKATKIETIAQLENQLLERETQLETLKGQLRTVQNQVSLATITLTLTEAAISPAIQLAVTLYPGADDNGLACPGDDRLSVEQGEKATVCFEIINVGDTALTSIALKDPVLEVELDDLEVVTGDPATALQPGESIMLAYGLTVARDVRTRTTVSATPVNADGETLGDRTVANTSTVFLDSVDPGGIPGFSEGISASWTALTRVAQVAVLVLGWMLPFVWVPVLAWLLWRRSVRRERETAPPEAPERELVGAGTGGE